MKFEVKGNINYCASIVKIEDKIELEGCDNICGTHIFGNHVIISKDVNIGDIGIFFPIETSIKDIFLKNNNLYRETTLNKDESKKGFFEKNGRVRCVKLRGFKSEGFWIPIESLWSFIPDWENIESIKENQNDLIGIEFDHIDGIMICEKYVIPSKIQSQNNSKSNKKNKKIKRFSKLIEEQFRFHIDTAQFGKNLHRFNLNDLISITEKVHGTSAIASYILCNKKLSWKNRIAKVLGIDVVEKEYDYIYSSRRVVKNQYLCENPSGFYSEDIWKEGFEELKPFLEKGMTIYYEICGFLKDNKAIQKMGKYIYDYGCSSNTHRKYVYRITSTNEDGKVFEWSMKQVQDWCKEKGLEAVHLHYYGTVKDFIFKNLTNEYMSLSDNNVQDTYYRTLSDDRDMHDILLKLLTGIYLEKDCSICRNKVPNEGICIRREVNDIDVYKLKSFAFRKAETDSLDKGEENIEDIQVTGEEN